jgi:hypothetical protein
VKRLAIFGTLGAVERLNLDIHHLDEGTYSQSRKSSNLNTLDSRVDHHTVNAGLGLRTLPLDEIIVRFERIRLWLP